MLPMIQNRGSKIKFQRELDVALSLRTVNDSEIAVEPSARRFQGRSVCKVEELRPELQFFEVAHREFLLKAQICSAQARTSDRTHTASSERAGNWWTVGSGIEPLEANELTGGTKSGFSPEHVWRCVAVGARPAGTARETGAVRLLAGQADAVTAVALSSDRNGSLRLSSRLC
jgi:hypothetical protein